MNRIRSISGILSILALVVLIGSLIVSNLMASGAELVQLIEPQDATTASLFGDSSSSEPDGIRLGSPQMMVIRDQKAFLTGTGSQGERFASKAYLDDHSLYPLQVKTIMFFRDVTTIVSGILTLVLGLSWWWLGSRRRSSAVVR